MHAESVLLYTSKEFLPTTTLARPERQKLPAPRTRTMCRHEIADDAEPKGCARAALARSGASFRVAFVCAGWRQRQHLWSSRRRSRRQKSSARRVAGAHDERAHAHTHLQLLAVPPLPPRFSLNSSYNFVIRRSQKRKYNSLQRRRHVVVVVGLLRPPPSPPICHIKRRNCYS